ncbi:hypothetical protein BJ508DRAFT_309297 [Ascobolus immersus RN42]|uniref:Uncharacterized protein n=1 Tax=Ascobolus immersus RN42 TaxID=1160509 RepID=A0A3N4I299_ASCIM|nr:hypothetical protein BJ508DRAFT_309297 [Ascobolus immersus RN42]
MPPSKRPRSSPTSRKRLYRPSPSGPTIRVGPFKRFKPTPGTPPSSLYALLSHIPLELRYAIYRQCSELTLLQWAHVSPPFHTEIQHFWAGTHGNNPLKFHRHITFWSDEYPTLLNLYVRRTPAGYEPIVNRHTPMLPLCQDPTHETLKLTRCEIETDDSLQQPEHWRNVNGWVLRLEQACLCAQRQQNSRSDVMNMTKWAKCRAKPNSRSALRRRRSPWRGEDSHYGDGSSPAKRVRRAAEWTPKGEVWLRRLDEVLEEGCAYVRKLEW